MGDMDWIDVAVDREMCPAVVNAVMNYGSIKCGEFVD